MDLKMHIYSVPLRSPFAFPRVPWYFEVGNASDQKLEVGNCVPRGELRSPTSYYTLTTACRQRGLLWRKRPSGHTCNEFVVSRRRNTRWNGDEWSSTGQPVSSCHADCHRWCQPVQTLIVELQVTPRPALLGRTQPQMRKSFSILQSQQRRTRTPAVAIG